MRDITAMGAITAIGVISAIGAIGLMRVVYGPYASNNGH